MQLIDTHCHLDEEAFDVDRPDVVARAVAAGLVRMLTIGTTAATSRQAVALADQFPHVFAVVGIQPNYAAQAAPGDWETIAALAASRKVVGIGETGLDRYWDYAPFDTQIDYFRRHLDLARTYDLPFVVHCREAERDVVAELRRAAEQGALRGVMHSFAGDADTARECVELGLFLSFSGMVTFKKSQALRDLVKDVPLDRILVETDAPYLAPQPWRGKRNEPAYVDATARCLAELLDVPPEEFAAQTTENARRLFRLSLDQPFDQAQPA